MNEELTASQKELLARIKIADKDNSIITAALIEAEVLIDSLKGAGFVQINPEDTTINFTDTTEFLVYDITIGKAIPATQTIQIPRGRFRWLYLSAPVLCRGSHLSYLRLFQ